MIVLELLLVVCWQAIHPIGCLFRGFCIVPSESRGLALLETWAHVLLPGAWCNFR